MWSTNNNLMELLSSRFTFVQAIEVYRREQYGDKPSSLSDFLEESYASPAIKRAITQTVAIVDEVVRIMKEPPAKIFVEVAREDGEKKRTVSLKNELLALYKKCGEEESPLFDQLEQRETDSSLRRDKLYLYYTQLGRCMYSDEEITLSSLDFEYNIDHIYLQSATKDDSLNNHVLVKQSLNKIKENNYPLPAD